MRSRALICCAGLSACAPAAVAQSYLMIPDSASDKIMLFSPADGSLVNADFIVDTGASPFDFQTPKDAIQVGNEVWVSDQVSDAVFRFDLQGNYLSTIGGGAAGGLDNIRGMALHNGIVYVSNDGGGNGSAVDTVFKFDAATGAPAGSFTSPLMSSPFDLLPLNADELLVANFTSTNILKYTISTNSVSAWSSTTVPLAEQINRRASGRYIVAGFSGTTAGLYEFDPDGNPGAYYAVPGPRGVYELANGNLLWTGSGGVNIYDVNTQTSTQVFPTSGAQFINPLQRGAPPCYANCDGSTAEPILNVNDFICFQTKYAAGDPGANCDGSTAEPILNVNDFICFQTRFAAGCP
jgi:hypothetical protein